MVLVLTATTVSAQNDEKPPKDLWTRTINVTLGDNWRQIIISVPGKGTPNVVDFFHAFAKAYPCEYHDLLAQALDGDEEVLFNHKKPRIEIDKDSCWMENESFSMRVFYEGKKPVALGVCCHQELSREAQEAYYYSYNNTTRKLIPLAQGSDFTGGIVKRHTSFSYQRDFNEAIMTHSWGRCGVESRLVWKKGKLTLLDPTKGDFRINASSSNIAMSVLQQYLDECHMELREPRPYSELPGANYNSLPVCIAIIDTTSGNGFAAAAAMEGYYYFYARQWKRADGTSLVAVYRECAPRLDYDFDREKNELVTTPHPLGAGDEVSLQFYLCDSTGTVTYMDPASPLFKNIVGKDLPDLEHNEWRCLLSPDNNQLVFVSEKDGERKTFQW